MFAGAADDDVIEQFHFEQLSGPDEIARGANVRLAGRWVAAGMTVHEDDGRGRADDGCTIGFPGMDEQRVERAGADQHVALDVPAGVEQQNVQAFHVWIEGGRGSDVFAPVLGGALGRVALEHLRRGFAQGSEFVFEGHEA